MKQTDKDKTIEGRYRQFAGCDTLKASAKLSMMRDAGLLEMKGRGKATERGGDTGTLPPDPIRQEGVVLIVAAKKSGCFVDGAKVPGTRYTIRTGESEVRLVQREQVYYKIKDPFAKLHRKKHPPEYVLFEHVVHNILFHDCRLEFLGVAENLHEARLVFRQKAIRADVRPDDNQISEYLCRIGLRPEGRYAFGNDYVFVTDVGQDGDNVLLDDNGQLRFIDPILGFKHLLLQKLSAALADEAEIAPLVYKLYGLTDDEIAIVEGRDKAAQEPQGETARRPAASSRRRRQSALSDVPASLDDEVLE